MTTFRRTGTASAATLAGLAVAIVLAHFAVPDLAPATGLDLWNRITCENEFRSAFADSSRLSDEEARLHESLQMTQDLAARLIAEKVTLAEATEVAERFHCHRPGFMFSIELYHPAPSLRLSISRYLLSHVWLELSDDPDRLATVLPRLEAEYAAMLGSEIEAAGPVAQP